MTETNVTAAEIRDWLDTHHKKPAWLAATIGVTKPTVGRWLQGQDIPEPMQHLLRLLVRGIMPPGFSAPRSDGELTFTPAEWRVIEICRVREGFPDAVAWIVHKIRAYLAMTNQIPALAVVEPPPPLARVAEDPVTYKTKTGPKK